MIASYAAFIAVAFAIYEGNRWLYFRLHAPDSWLTRPWARLRVLLGTVVLFTLPLAGVSLGAWRSLTGDPSATWGRVATGVLLVVIATLVIVHIYETVFVLREWAGDRLRAERQRRRQIETELELLKMEVDPHVLFNHLNSLSHLVETADPRAPTFVRALAASYRALVRTRGRRLVPLAEELQLLDEFRSLMAIRLGTALRVDISVPHDEAERWHLPPVVLPELVENAVKHNEATPADPLILDIAFAGGHLVVENRIRPKSTLPESTGVGLRNLADRFRLTTDRPVTWSREDGRFRLLLPLVPASAAHRASPASSSDPRGDRD